MKIEWMNKWMNKWMSEWMSGWIKNENLTTKVNVNNWTVIYAY
jgi:hypothetical protein